LIFAGKERRQFLFPHITGGFALIDKSDWEQLVGRYNLIKELYIEGEETDPELKTNLQPLNEFRAALDHIIRIIAIEKLDLDVYDAALQFDKLKSHLRRAFFDVCDVLAINYRNKCGASTKTTR
jgi:hypothetical protein